MKRVPKFLAWARPSVVFAIAGALAAMAAAVFGQTATTPHAAGVDPAQQIETEWLLQDAMRYPPTGAGKPAPAAKAPSAEPSVYPIRELVQRGRQLAAQRRREGVPVDSPIAALDRLSENEKGLAGKADPHARRALYLQARLVVRKLVLADPRLRFDKLLCVKRPTYQSSHIYTDHYDGSTLTGGNLCMLSPVAPDGRITEIAPQLAGGLFGRFDLSFDARQVVFAYKRPGQGYRIYEIGIDGRGLRQLTFDEPDEPQVQAQFGHGYDDVDPCYLPSGKVLFTSTRSRRAVLCTYNFTTASLFVMDGDGRNLRCLSGNTVNEFTPSVMHDGRVLYTRWEYVDKGVGDVQSLWSMHPDGSHPTAIYKNNVRRPATLIDGRSIPGSHRVVATGAPHMPLAVGPIVLIDTHMSPLTPMAMTNLTPEITYPGHNGYFEPQRGYYKEPYPLSEDLFLVAYNPGPNHAAPAGYGLYLLDAAGNRELVYRDPAVSCFQPTPLVPRQRPPELAPVSDQTAAKGALQATLVLADVYAGMTGIPRGAVKYVRVMEDVPKPWKDSWLAPSHGDVLGLQNPAISLDGHFAVKVIRGIVPVAKDGSASFTVPAEKNLYFQALDENFMEVQRMRTFVNLRPGERRSCIGCHEPRNNAPTSRRATALNDPPRELAAQPGDAGPRAVDYARDVQPILDRHCVRCHGPGKAEAGLDLSGELTTLFNRSYENLIRKNLVNHINIDPRDAFIPAEPPLTFGSHRSKLVEVLRRGRCEAKLSREEFIRLVTWIDANAPYYGTYEGKKNLKWKGDPQFRPEPVVCRY